jgi:hypothetical protein
MTIDYDDGGLDLDSFVVRIVHGLHNVSASMYPDYVPCNGRVM